MPDIRKALVIGAGPAGLAAAIQLKRKNGISCTVYEIHQEPTTLGGAIGIPSNGLRLLDRLGVYEPLFGLAANTVNTVAYSSKGIELGEIDLWYWAREKTGYGFMRVMRTDLQNMMLDAVLKEGIQIHYGKKMVSVEENDSEVIATFSDGTKDTADLLLGCDGIHSSVRTFVHHKRYVWHLDTRWRCRINALYRVRGYAFLVVLLRSAGPSRGQYTRCMGRAPESRS